MIVKNEAHVIERCLKSLLPHISHWVICDTGSTDGTQEKIKELLKDVPGELYEDPWVHFAHNRTLAIQRAKGKGDYHLMMDADHEWHGKLPPLDGPGYVIEHRYDSLVYGIPIVMKDGFDWEYECPIHETVRCKEAGPFQGVPGKFCYVKVYPEGARSKDPRKYHKDAEILQKHVDEHPDDARATYYLAQSYWNSGQIEKAREWYGKRAQMANGWWEEQWHALYRLAQTAQQLDLPFAVVMTEYLSAYQANPKRAEPLVTLARYARLKGYHSMTVMACRQAMTLPRPEIGLFLEPLAYGWVPLDEFGVSAFYAGFPEEGAKACQKLLRHPELPAHERKRVEVNLAHYRQQQKAA